MIISNDSSAKYAETGTIWWNIRETLNMANKVNSKHLAPHAGFSIDMNFQDVTHAFWAKKFGRQCAKSGSHAAGLQENSSKN